MKSYNEKSSTRIDSVLCALVVAVAFGSVAWAAVSQVVGNLTA